MPSPRLRDRAALAVLGAGALATALVVLPYRSFELDRFFLPKEVALHASAALAALVLLIGVRRFVVTRVDVMLAAWVALSIVSALFATNHWVAYRALTITLSGALVFWSARRVGEAALGGAFARMLALVVVAGAATALAQAYGLKMEFATLNRAPGGTFGNRNFMAHLSAAGLPLILYCVATSRSGITAAWWTASLMATAGALVLSRTRAAWLALLVCGVLALLVLFRGPPLLETPEAKRRLRLGVGAAVTGIALALALPNRLDWKSDNPYLDSVVGVMNYREGSGRGRLRQYSNSLKLASAHPLLGVGPGNWAVAYPRIAPPDDPSLLEGTGTTANPWPSSDWVAALAERGVPALLAYAAVMILLVGTALRVRWDSSLTSQERLLAVAGAGVVGVAVVEGAFDAVLLLATPTALVWCAAGAMIPVGRTAGMVPLTGGARGGLLIAVLAVGVTSTLAGVERVEAMALYERGTTTSLEDAARRDPGSYRIRMRAAEIYVARNQCGNARRHALAARALLPAAIAPKRVLAECR
jgi:hypothetical protein